MKANQLIDSVINLNRNGPLIYPSETGNSYRIRISKYLIKVGLKKHRYSDGYYYYGIKRKIILNEKINQDDLLKIIEKRKDELQSFTK
jgi:hypothetical protein